jgi:hypothetical protein
MAIFVGSSSSPGESYQQRGAGDANDAAVGA